MAITRCPYCHAIIDENDKYCNNCGTQLLFADDEEIEEEIPGEKIIDAPAEEKDYTVDEPEDEKRPKAAKDLESEIDEELADEVREKTEEMALDEIVAEGAEEDEEGDLTEEVILVDELAASEAAAKDGSQALEDKAAVGAKTPEPVAVKGKDEEEADLKDEDEEDEEEQEESESEEDEEDEAGEEELADELEEEEEEEGEEEEKDKKGLEGGMPEPAPHKDEETREYAVTLKKEPPAEPLPEADIAAAAEEAEVEYVREDVPPDQSATAGEAGLRPATFDSKELENLGKTVELSKLKVERFLEGRSEKPAVAPPPPPAITPEEPPVPPTGSLPPWASTMKGAPVFDPDTGPVETRKLRGGEPATPEGDDEFEIFPKRRASDSTIGLPEKVGQAPLPFEAPASGEEEPEDEGEAETAEDTGFRDLTPQEAVLPAGQVRPHREPVLPVREPGAPASSRPEAEAPEEAEERGPRPPFSFSVFFKSKAFDILFVGLFWLVALWLAASSMGVTLFTILGEMSGSMLLLYAVFVTLYFFLFKFFLGETLGDRLFRPRE